jgi:error-prone DNA polymerase
MNMVSTEPEIILFLATKILGFGYFKMKKEVGLDRALLSNGRSNSKAWVPPYIELLSQSCFSFLQGASHPEELVETAIALGYRGLALTDENGFYGIVRAYDKVRTSHISTPPFKFLVGTQIQIEGARLSFIAKNFTGYKQLCRLISAGFENRPKRDPLFSRDHLKNWISAEHIFSFILPREFPNSDLLKFLTDTLSPIQLISRYYHPDLDQPLAQWLKNLSPDIPRAWTWDAQFHRPDRHELYEVLRAIRSNIPLKNLRPSANGERYLKSLSELHRLQIPSNWIHKTFEIAEACHFSPAEIRYRYPHEFLPAGKTSAEFLKDLCDRGLEIRYQGRPSQEVLKQLSHELEIIRQLQFEDYFLTVWDIVKFARSQNILCQGRGSAANSIVCYLLEVTAIDPIHMNLLFERFISAERNEAPDIDVDLARATRRGHSISLSKIWPSSSRYGGNPYYLSHKICHSRCGQGFRPPT